MLAVPAIMAATGAGVGVKEAVDNYKRKRRFRKYMKNKKKLSTTEKIQISSGPEETSLSPLHAAAVNPNLL